MKKLYLLLFTLLSISVHAQTYNIVLEPALSMSDTIVRDQTFGTWNYMRNNSTAPVDYITFSWYISSDSAFDAGDFLLDSWTTDPDDSYLNPGTTASIGTALAKVPSSYSLGCSYFIIMRAEINAAYTETNYQDNFSYKRVCLRAKRIDLEATSISSDKNPYYKGINSTQAIISGSITNEGELPVGAFDYDVKLGSSPDPLVGNIYSVRKSISSLAEFSSASISETFDISTLEAGVYYLFLYADPDNQISDPVINNNLLTRSFQITYQDSLDGESVNMPAGAEARYIATCNTTIYDDGGPSGDYSPNTDGTINLYPAEADKRIRVTVKNYNFSSYDYLRVYYKNCVFCGYTSLGVTNTSTFPLEFVNTSSDGIIYLKQYSNASTQTSGAEIEISCAPALEYKAAISGTLKQKHAADIDTINFNFSIQNRGYATIPSLKYTYGIAATAGQDNVLYESEIKTSSSVNVNSSISITNTKLGLNDVNITTAGTYYLFVKTGVDNPDENLEDNIAYYPLEIVFADLAEDISVNMQNGTDLYYTTCNMTIYDDGGPTGNYSNDFSGRAYLYPAESDKVIKLKVEYDLESRLSGHTYVLKDILSVFDSYTNVKKVTLPVAYYDYYYIAKDLTGGALAVDFISDATTVKSGFKITLGCAYKGVDYSNDNVDVLKDTVLMGVDTSIKYNGRMSNNGTGNNLSQVKLNLYVSTSPDKADAVLTAADLNYNLGASYNLYSLGQTAVLDISSITLPGKYYLISEIDPANTISEIDENNNVVVDSFYIKALPEGELRLPETSFYTVSECDFKLYDYMGPNQTSTINGTESRIIINPVDGNNKLKFKINSFTANHYDVIIQVYERSINASSPVATFYRNTEPVEYVASDFGSPIEIRATVRIFGGGPYTFNLDADVSCESTVTGINHNQEAGFSVHPVPVTDKMFFKTPGPCQVLVYNASGALVFSNAIGSDDEVNTQSWAAGVYVVQFITTEGTVTRRIVKQ